MKIEKSFIKLKGIYASCKSSSSISGQFNKSKGKNFENYEDRKSLGS